MVDVASMVREYLLGQSAVTSLLGTNLQRSIYAACDLPEHFDPKLGAAIQLFRSGGKAHSEINGLIDARVEIRAWADVEKYVLASQVYGAIFDALHGAQEVTLNTGALKRALEVSAPQEISDPETGWVSMFAFYTVLAAPNS